MKLQLKITAIVIAIMALAGLVGGGTIIYLQRNIAKSNFEKSASALANAVLASLEHDMLQADRAHIQEALAQIGASPGVNEAVIFNPEGYVAASAEESELGEVRDDPEIREVLAKGKSSVRMETTHGLEELCVLLPVVNKSACQGCHDPSRQVLGVIEVGLDSSPLAAQMREQVLLMGGFALGGFLAVTVAITYVFRRTITNRLSRLGNMAAKLAEGDYSVRSLEKGKDEIGTLGRVFDNMIDRLDERTQDLYALQQDLEERVKARTKELEGARNYLRTALDSLEDQVMSIDKDYRIILVNRVLVEQMGWMGMGIQGRYCYEVSHGRKGPCHEYGEDCPLRRVWEKGIPHKVTHVHVASDGEEHYLEIIASPVKDRDGNTVEVLEVLRDVSERVRAEKQTVQYATERAQLLRKLISAQEEERKRVARDLHDEVGQALTTVALGAASAAEALPPRLKAIKAKLEETRSHAMHALADVRRLVAELRPDVLDDLGLVAASRSYVKGRLEVHDIEVGFQATGLEQRLPSRVEIVLFRVIQEAVTNVLRHAQATRVRVKLELAGSQLKLVVEDNGRGFDVRKVLAGPSWGLHGIEERVMILGGSLDIKSEPGQGTRLFVSIPVEDDGNKSTAG